MSPEFESRMPPRDLMAEQSVLGAICKDGAAMDVVTALLRAEDFYTDAHQKLYAALLGLAGKPIDLVILHSALESCGKLDDVGGSPYLAEVWDACPSAANVEHYASIVRDKSLLRSLIHVGNEILRDAWAAVGPPAEAVARAERAIFALSERGVDNTFVRVYEPARRLIQSIEDRKRVALETGTPISRGGKATGIAWYDKITGGLHSELTIIAARPSIGKTAIAKIIALNMSLSGHTIYFASLEMSEEELAGRVLTSLSGVQGQRIRQAETNEDEDGLLCRALIDLSAADLLIGDAPVQSIRHIAACCRRIKRKGRLDAVFIDYLQLIEPEDRRSPRHEQVAAISRRLKQLSRELDVPVVVLSQLNRESEQGKGTTRPKLSHLRESGGLEQDADTVLLLHRNEDTPGMLDFLLEKQRNGPTGEVSIKFDRNKMRLEEGVF